MYPPLPTKQTGFSIFMAACISVLFLGTIYGVLIGVLLSFFAVITKIRESNSFFSWCDSRKR